MTNVNKCIIFVDPGKELEDIKKLRQLGDECIKNVYVRKYVDDVMNDVVFIIRLYAEDHKLDFDEILKERLSRDDKTSAGQVKKDDIPDMIRNGNIREKMTGVLHNFFKQSCDIFLWLQVCIENKSEIYEKHLKYIIHEKNAQKIIQRTRHLSGMQTQSIYNIVKEQSKDKILSQKLPCIFSIFVSETVMISNSPFYTTPVRIPKNKQSTKHRYKRYKVKVRDVNPPLSHREISYMGLTNKQLSSNKSLPWITGKEYFNVCKNSVYVKLASMFNEISISGPSGHTSFFLQLTSILKRFNVEKSILACLAYMLNSPDHSVHEIIMEGIPYNLDYDVSQISSIEYTHKLLEKVNKQEKLKSL